MSRQPETETEIYEIRVRGHLAPHRLGHFEGLVVRQQPGGDTMLEGPVRDQSALYGLLTWLHKLGVPLISVRRLEKAGAREEQGDSECKA
jgi:hypothetical protein